MVKHYHSNKHLSISERLFGMKGAHDTKMIHVVQCIAICQYTYQKHTALPIPKTCTVVTKAVQEQLHAHISSFHGQGKGGVQSISRKNTHTDTHEKLKQGFSPVCFGMADGTAVAFTVS
jgi:hypothetical protein